MREILFRGKRVDNDKWVEGSLIRCNYPDKEEFIHKNNLPGEFDELQIILPETVGQFTGLTDKNGAKIFEGDILEICNGSINCSPWMEKNKEVVFKNGSFNVPIWSFDSTHWFKVIGNIHDNPELLK